MKKLLFLSLLWALPSFAQFAQPPNGMLCGGVPCVAPGNPQINAAFILIGPRTIASAPPKIQLPAANSNNTYWISTITDGATATDCTTGGGSTLVLCISTG